MFLMIDVHEIGSMDLENLKDIIDISMLGVFETQSTIFQNLRCVA